MLLFFLIYIFSINLKFVLNSNYSRRPTPKNVNFRRLYVFRQTNFSLFILSMYEYAYQFSGHLFFHSYFYFRKGNILSMWTANTTGRKHLKNRSYRNVVCIWYSIRAEMFRCPKLLSLMHSPTFLPLNLDSPTWKICRLKRGWKM